MSAGMDKAAVVRWVAFLRLPIGPGRGLNRADRDRLADTLDHWRTALERIVAEGAGLRGAAIATAALEGKPLPAPIEVAP